MPISFELADSRPAIARNPMHRRTLFGLCAAIVGLSAITSDAADKFHERSINPAYGELAKMIHGDDVRSKSARLQLAYAEGWNRHRDLSVWKSVKTLDGKQAEVVFIKVPTCSIPGTDFTMALLLSGGRVVDWASCWTSNREYFQELVLEDVDGDHLPDIGFRGNPGFWAQMDTDINGHAKKKPVWLAAYSVTSTGLKPLIAKRERIHRLVAAPGRVDGPLAFRVTGLPASLPESDLCDCTVSVTTCQKRRPKSHLRHSSPASIAGGWSRIHLGRNSPLRFNRARQSQKQLCCD
jgi:hypothetical protein